jgi:hypothetical protein
MFVPPVFSTAHCLSISMPPASIHHNAPSVTISTQLTLHARPALLHVLNAHHLRSVHPALRATISTVLSVFLVVRIQLMQ